MERSKEEKKRERRRVGAQAIMERLEPERKACENKRSDSERRKSSALIRSKQDLELFTGLKQDKK